MAWVRTHFFIFSVTLCAMVFVVSAFYLGRTVRPQMVDPCPGEAGMTNTCWGEYYRHVLDERGATKALADLERRYMEGSAAGTFCHPILHQIGAHAAKEYGSVAEAYNHGRTFCRAGYYHGVLEGIFGEEGGEKLLTQLDTICAQIPGKERYSYNYFSCVHGIGHGLMAFYDHNLLDTLKSCANLTGAWEQSSCAGGVFMENVISNTPEMPSKYLSDDPHYPCNAIDDAFKYQCYLMQTSHMLTLFGGDFEKTFEACTESEEPYRITCYQSLGRDASGWSYGKIEAALSYCALGSTLEQRTNCDIGAAVDFIQSVDEESARSLCALAEDGARVPCIRVVEAQLRAQ